MTARISLKTVTKTFKLIWSGIFFTQYMEMCELLVRQLKREMIANEIICHFLRENWQRSNMFIWIYKSIYIYILSLSEWLYYFGCSHLAIWGHVKRHAIWGLYLTGLQYSTFDAFYVLMFMVAYIITGVKHCIQAQRISKLWTLRSS